MEVSESVRPPRLPVRKPWWSTHLPADWLRTSESFRPGEGVTGSNDDADVMRFVRGGWMMRSRFLHDGRRQGVELLLPGDHLPGRPAYRSDLLSALSHSEVVSVPSAVVQDARDRSPELDAVLGAAEERRAAILNERIVTLGQRTALERTAHLFCVLVHRVGEGEPAGACELPMVQADLADLLGLSVVHTNRTLQALRQMSLIQVGRGWLCVVDLDALAKLAGFSSAYLSS